MSVKSHNYLLPEQVPLSDDVYQKIDKRELFNIPTGRGKTYILLDVARRLIEEGKPVIISVPNNYLAREMYDIALSHFDFSKESSVIKIGKTNYVDYEKLVALYMDNLLDDYCDRASLESYIEKYKDVDVLFMDDFFRSVTLLERFHQKMVSNLICFSDKTKFSIDFGLLTITNHYYLMTKVIKDKNFEVSDYVVLIDEVHQILEVGNTILTDNFSPFEMKNTLSIILKELKKQDDFHGKITFMKNVQSLLIKANRIYKKHLSPEKVGEYEVKLKITTPLKKDILSLLESKESIYIWSKLSKNGSIGLINAKDLFERHYKILASLKSDELVKREVGAVSDSSFGVFYSPSKGFPNLKFSLSNPLFKIHYGFWEKIVFFAGVSGSVTSSFMPTDKERDYAYKRLGICWTKEDFATHTLKLHFYPRLFPKENTVIVTPVKGGLIGTVKKENVYTDGFKIEDSAFYEMIIDNIFKNHNNKNTLVLCGGYKEAKVVELLYKKKYGDVITDYAKKEEKTLTTLARFKERGGILFGTRNYNTGTSLVGKHLERLFILKFPYPDFTEKRWQELKMFSEQLFRGNMNKEMLISLIQTLGRLARTSTDTGKIFILDSNYITYRSDLKRNVQSIFETYGIIRPEKEEVKPASPEKSLDDLFG